MHVADLHRSVQTTLASKRLGTPVFVRYLFHSEAEPAVVLRRLTQITSIVRGWLEQPLERIYGVGGVADRHIALTLECRGGATAQIAWIGTAPRGPGIDLTLLGNHGALYHDFAAANPWDAASWDDKQPADAELTAWIERALRSKQPESSR